MVGDIIKIGVIFGGTSTEHDISKISGSNILSNLDKEKYEVYAIYIDKDGNYYEYKPEEYKMLSLDSELDNLYKIDNVIDYLKKLDKVFPVLHGLYGEDGTIQGLLELLNIPYVGCKVLSSSICMDKVYTKDILKSAGINVSKSMYIKKYKDKYIYIDDKFNEIILDNNELIDKVDELLGYPVFIKPSRSGSSIGVYKSNKDDLISNLENAFKYDSKVLIEEEIIGRELEVGVLESDELIASNIGEILKDDFYTFDSKYRNDKENTRVVDDLDKDLEEEIKNTAKKAFLACDCSDLARVDFFLDKNNKIIVNEINTMPGFTSISMYPKLFNSIGLSTKELLDKLIEHK